MAIIRYNDGDTESCQVRQVSKRAHGVMHELWRHGTFTHAPCRSAAAVAHWESGSDHQVWLPQGPAALGAAVWAGLQGERVPAECALHAVLCCCHMMANFSSV